MKQIAANLAVLVGLLGSHAVFAEDIRVFLARQNIQQDIQQGDVVKPGTTIQTLGGGLVVLVESEMLTGDRSKECQYWTVISSQAQHVVKSKKGKGCTNDERALDSALASAQSGRGGIAHAAFQVVHLPALGKGDVRATDSEAAVGRFVEALRKIPKDPPSRRETDLPPGLEGEIGKQKVNDPGGKGAVTDWNAAYQKTLNEKATKKKAKTANVAADKESEKRMRAEARAGETKRRLKEAEPRKGVRVRGKRIDPETASSRMKTGVALAAIEGTSIEDLSLETGLPAEVIEDWHARFIAGGQASFEDAAPVQCDEQLSELEEKIGELYLENDRLRESCEGKRR